MSAPKDLPTSPKAGGSIDKDIDVQTGKLGTGPGYSGQEYDSQAHASERALDANASDGVTPPAADAALPPDNGKRASYDPATGAARGSGAGAGGGNAGEDFDSDAATGDGFPQTGRDVDIER
ncbi:hypothetical protein PX554_05770 [Sphingomonas sp. H39-1-10]|uniref:hypothetical protein n=1 Tax=Sphingomonas TaxID=13687 RepID=UPI00115FF1A6|nr:MULTISPECIES: hypothetical protein [Sphingomonas]MDF0487630.1 hypothetical protein [Sphingomonas pollutisoli]